MQNGLFNITEEQQSLVELIRDFMTKEIKPHVLEWEKEGHYPQEIIEQGIEMGLHMLQVPERVCRQTDSCILKVKGHKLP